MPSKYKRKSSSREPYKKIIIAMEGNHTEPRYFKEIRFHYRTPTLIIEILERDENDTRSSPGYVIDQLNDYRRQAKVQSYDELWLVIDKDRWPDSQLSQIAAECYKKKKLLFSIK